MILTTFSIISTVYLVESNKIFSNDYMYIHDWRSVEVEDLLEPVNGRQNEGKPLPTLPTPRDKMTMPIIERAEMETGLLGMERVNNKHPFTLFQLDGYNFDTHLPFSHYLWHGFHCESEQSDQNRVKEQLWRWDTCSRLH